MKFYKIDVSNISKKKIKIIAEDILANKLCKCIKKVTPLLKNEQNAIAVCRKSVLRQKQIMNFGFRCKKGARFIPKKGTSKNLAKIKRKTNATRKRRKTKNKSRI
tara:strand:+ start:1683 stop:1997 length:315 start_codon:yes stop_codon:yes gene_type:complete